VVVGGAGGVATLDVRGGSKPSVRSRRGVVVNQGRKAFAVRIVNIQHQLGGQKQAWQELWSLELPDGKPRKLWGNKQTRRMSIDATGRAGLKLRITGHDGNKTIKHLAAGPFTGGGKPGALRPKADKDGWVALGDGCGHIRVVTQGTIEGVEVRPAGSKTSVVAKVSIGAPRAIMGVTPLSARARFDLRWMFNQRVHADTLLKKGRRLTRAGNFGFAIATLAEALLFKPADSTIVGEMAWAALRKGDQVKAKRWSKQALRWARNKRQQAIARYNLGRIAQAGGEVGQALTHYRASHELRPNASVKARIDKLSASKYAPDPEDQ
jgi:hypothetical protein